MRKVALKRAVGMLIVSIFCVAAFASVHAQVVVNITATVPSHPDTVVSFSGIAYPNAPITILQDGLAFLTTNANAQADFSVSKSGVTSGMHSYTLSAKDADSRDAVPITIVVDVTSEATTTVSNIFFGPTIELSDVSISEGDSLTVFGTTSPGSSVAIYLTKTTTTIYTVTANSSGEWTRVFSGELSEGSYSVRARATDPDASVSQYSTTLYVTVGAPPDPCLASNHADMNCDGEVDLTDLSILLSYWRVTNPGNARTDINADTIVNLFDFSIMMFNWTGPV